MSTSSHKRFTDIKQETENIKSFVVKYFVCYVFWMTTQHCVKWLLLGGSQCHTNIICLFFAISFAFIPLTALTRGK